MISAGDPLNGAGTTTGASSRGRTLPCLTADFRFTAWSLTYLFLHGKKALLSKRPAPIALASVVLAQALAFGAYYADGSQASD
jgi:hypothetical protein